jgi:DNA-binding response OmpR family regulator
MGTPPRDDLSRRRAQARDKTAMRGGTCEPIRARLILRTPEARAKLLGELAEGRSDFLLVSSDGELATRVHVAPETLDASEELSGGSGVTIDWRRGTISKGESRVRLAPSELRLLAALVEVPRRVVTRSQLAARLWPAGELERAKEDGLPVYICMLRRRLSAISLGDALQTVRGRGYRLEL